MKSKFYLIPLLFASYAGFSQTIYSKETLQKIEEVESNVTPRLILNNAKPTTITDRMQFHKVNGLSIAVINNYKIEWAKAYGFADVKDKKPMTTETLFEPGSISKSLNAIGILKLAQEKQVDLNTDINTYLNSWKFPYDSISKGKKITLTHLLSHQAGLTVHGFPGHDIYGPTPTIYEVLDGKKPSFTPAVRSQFEPGLRFQYSGGGTSISQVILTDVTAQPYEFWMYENVLKPIGMIHSFYNQPPAQERQSLCASAYNRDGIAFENKFHVYPEQAAAGLWMTPSDLCNYIIDMQLAYKGGKSKVLNDDMVKLHLTPYNNGPTALGTFIEDRNGAKYFQHGAGNDGFCGQFYGSLDDGYGIAIFMNTDDPKLLREVINSVAKVYNWKNFYEAPRVKKSVKLSDEIKRSYEGVYAFENMYGIILKIENEHYLFSTGTFAKMYFNAPDEFFNEEFASEKKFIKNEKGEVTGYTRKVGSVEHPNAIKLNVENTNMTLEEYNAIGWAYLETKNFAEAKAWLNRGLQLYPTDLVLIGNLAHIELFKGDYAKAIAIYKTHVNKPCSNEMLWNDMVREDLKYLKSKGFNSKIANKALDELKF